MGRNTTRWFIKRDMKQAQARLEKIENYLARCGMLFEPKHKDIYDGFCACMRLTHLLKESLATLERSI